MTGADLPPNIDPLTSSIAELKKPGLRAEDFAQRLKTFLAAQIRALRGDLSQTEFGKRIGKPQSVVSRLEGQSYGKVNLQTLIDIASKLNMGLIVGFVSLPTFWKWTNDHPARSLMLDSNNDRTQDLPGHDKETNESNKSASPERLRMVHQLH
jgi:hypothetical protein